MRHHVLEKDISHLILSRSSNLPIVVAQPNKRLAKRTQKSKSVSVWLPRCRVLGSYEQMSEIQKISTFILKLYQYEPPAISTTKSFW